MNGRIVLIEDDPDIAAMVQEMLVDLGHAVDVHAELIDGAFDPEAELVITDLIGLGSYDGDAARAWVGRVRAAFPKARVMIATGHRPARDQTLGADAVVIKPFEIAPFSATVRSLLG